jgi:uncharacterized delta-60 repeat protein
MLRTWLRHRRRGHTRPTRQPASRPLVERLEDRRLLNAGTLDPFFGFLGRVVTPKLASAADAADAAAFQADGKLLVAGTSDYGPAGNASDGAFAVARYNASGMLDPSFGVGGRATAFFGPNLTGPSSFSLPTVGGIAVQPDGKIVLAGSLSGGFGSTFAVARFTRNGWLDPTFGTGGEVLTTFTGTDSAAAVAVQADGRIVVVGQAGNTSFALARYNANGTLDATFGSGGQVTTRLSSADIDAAQAVTVQAGGEIVVAGSAGVFNQNSSGFALLRYGSNGTLDSATTTGFGSGVFSDARAVTVLANGTIRAAGRAGSNMGLAQYTSAGALDTSFGTGGTVTTPFAYNFAPAGEGVSFTPSGQVVVVGSTGGAASDFGVERYNANGSVDTTFGTNGQVTTDFGGTDAAFAVAAKSDGTLAVVGSTDSNLGDFAVARYRASGSPLTTFVRGGRVTTNFFFSTVEPTDPVFGPPQLTGGFTAALPGGGFVVAGTVAPDALHGEFLLARYTANGRLDTTFGNGGEVVTSFGTGASASAAALALTPDGKIVVVGSVTVPNSGTGMDVAVARYTANGSLDTTFNGTGTRAVDFNGSNDTGSGVAVQSDGKIVVVGTTSDPTTFNNDFALARINTDGTLDSHFGTGGEAFSDFGGAEASGVVVLTSGAIVVGGTTTNPVSFNSDLAAARYGSGGVLDTTFGVAGLALADFAGPSEGSSIAVAPGGAIVVGGTTANVTNPVTGLEQDFALARFTAGGTPDPTFGGGSGQASFAFDNQIYDCAAIAIQPDGKILMAGTRTDTTAFNSDFALARVNADGTLDTSFGNGGLVTTDFGGTDVAASIVLAPDGRIVVGGTTFGNGGGGLALACYSGDR